jgi:hypothetical protein
MSFDTLMSMKSISVRGQKNSEHFPNFLISRKNMQNKKDCSKDFTRTLTCHVWTNITSKNVLDVTQLQAQKSHIYYMRHKSPYGTVPIISQHYNHIYCILYNL